MKNYVKRISQKADKLSKEQLLELFDEVIDENESYRSIIDSLSSGILILDNKFILQRHNKIAESRLPFKARLEEAKNSKNPIWTYIDDEEIASFLENCEKKEITNSSEEFSTITPGGSIRFVSITISPLVHEYNFNGSIIIIRDITDKKNQEVLMHRMENLANLTNLAAGMAHEIKNPLGAISIHIQLIQKALKKARENQDVLPGKKFVEDHIDVVNEEIEHLNKLVMDFLTAVRPVKATLELKDPDKILSDLIVFLKPEFNRFGIKINFDPSGKSQRIMLDEKLFREIFINLSQNSLAAIKSKYPECKENCCINENVEAMFSIESRLVDNKIIIKISDNGCGMSEETLAKIFEPYYTTKANGTGLGMTMVYKIVKEFSGDILVDSTENVGTTFTLSFPIPQKDTKLLAQG
ncbi:MAG: PAS domain S-box protein [Treponema sp.]|nr:PAS domain S-box protein [Treponema sp.]